MYTTPTELRFIRTTIMDKCETILPAGSPRRDLEASRYVALWRQLKNDRGCERGNPDVTLHPCHRPVNNSEHSQTATIPGIALLDLSISPSRQEGFPLFPRLYPRREAVWCSLDGLVDELLPDVGLLG